MGDAKLTYVRVGFMPCTYMAWNSTYTVYVIIILTSEERCWTESDVRVDYVFVSLNNIIIICVP